MPFSYLNNKSWTQITREERFFCQHLYSLINAETPERFVAYLHGTHGLDVPIEGEWEIGYEVCFYRDLWHLRGRTDNLFSSKRTFDLCLFGERAIVIIEAKAAVGFDSSQNADFAEDTAEVRRLTGVEKVWLMGLCSSKYKPRSSTKADFNGPIVTWKDLAAHYGNDTILLRADDVYEPPIAYFDRKCTGLELIDAYHRGESWWVGRRGGGLHGDSFKDDVLTGKWQRRLYDTNTGATEPPSRNYFSLREFAEAVKTSLRKK